MEKTGLYFLAVVATRASIGMQASEPSAAAQARNRIHARLLLGAADGAELALGFLDGLGQGCVALQGRGLLGGGLLLRRGLLDRGGLLGGLLGCLLWWHASESHVAGVVYVLLYPFIEFVCPGKFK